MDTEVRETKFEYKLFDMVLKVGVVIFSLRVIKELIWSTSHTVLILDVCQLVICIVSMYLIKLGIERVYLIRSYCLIWILFFLLYWINLGGFDGPMTYVYFSLMVIYNGILRRRFRYMLVSLLSVLCMFLVFDNQLLNSINIVPYYLGNQTAMAFDFIVNSIIMALIVIYIKTSFDAKRNEIRAHNQNLEVLNMELSDKSMILKNQQQEIIQIKNNLEQLVGERTEELTKTNKQLKDYAYDNAHHVRGPLTNILSAVNLVGSISDKEVKDDLSSIKKHAEELDAVINKINIVLN